MTHLAAVPLWAAIPAALLLVFGAGLTLAGMLGLVRLPSFYQRIHAPSLGASFGTVGVVLASAIVFSATEARPVLHELLIGVFVTVTTPVTMMLLGRAALYRDRAASDQRKP
jgi:multicomponent K+:H+ antiporter subunit G